MIPTRLLAGDAAAWPEGWAAGWWRAVVGVPQGGRPAPPSAVSSWAAREYVAGGASPHGIAQGAHASGVARRPGRGGWKRTSQGLWLLPRVHQDRSFCLVLKQNREKFTVNNFECAQEQNTVYHPTHFCSAHRPVGSQAGVASPRPESQTLITPGSV